MSAETRVVVLVACIWHALDLGSNHRVGPPLDALVDMLETSGDASLWYRGHPLPRINGQPGTALPLQRYVEAWRTGDLDAADTALGIAQDDSRWLGDPPNVKGSLQLLATFVHMLRGQQAPALAAAQTLIDEHPAKPPRLDLYGPIHKALRQFMGHTLQRVGAMDTGDAEEREQVLGGVVALLGFMRSHLAHENDYIHTAIEARRAGGARRTADDHLLHLEAIGNLEDEAAALRVVHDAHRATLAQRLYRHLGEFVGENVIHMQVEETRNNALLWALYSDAEIAAIHQRLLAGIAPADMALATRGFAAALNIHELSGMFGEMQETAPAPAFEALLDIARTQLDDRRWAQLARALGRPPVPGLVTV